MRKSLAVFGEGPTEWFYLDALRIAGRFPFKMHPSLPQHSDVNHILLQAKKCLNEGYDEVVCLMDMDRLRAFPKELQRYEEAKRQKTYSRVTFIETDPCTEYWFLLHFVDACPGRQFGSYEELEAELRKYIPEYSKTEQYLRKNQLLTMLSQRGSLENAISRARLSVLRHKEGMPGAYTQMFKLFDKLKEFSKEK